MPFTTRPIDGCYFFLSIVQGPTGSLGRPGHPGLTGPKASELISLLALICTPTNGLICVNGRLQGFPGFPGLPGNPGSTVSTRRFGDALPCRYHPIVVLVVRDIEAKWAFLEKWAIQG